MMYRETGYCLLVDMREDGPIPDGVYCFNTEDEALAFAITMLGAYGWSPEAEQTTREDCLLEYQDGLDGHDYYHLRVMREDH